MCAPPGHGTIADMIEVRELTKDYGGKRAVNRLSFTAWPGVVTGFLGLSEMALTADQLLIIGRGELITEASMSELTDRFRRDVFVRTPRRGGLTRVLSGMGATVLAEPSGGLSVTGLDAWRIASAAAEHHIPIQELTPRSASLEEVYLELTNASVEYRVEPAGHLDRRPAS